MKVWKIAKVHEPSKWPGVVKKFVKFASCCQKPREQGLSSSFPGARNFYPFASPSLRLFPISLSKFHPHLRCR